MFWKKKYKVYPYTQIVGNVKIGEGSVIGAHCDLIDKAGGISIGKNVRIQSFCFMSSMVTIEDNVFIGPRVTFIHNNHPKTHRAHWRPILVKKGATIGAGTIILPGVVIEEGAMVGAGSVVTKDIPANTLVLGNPAKTVWSVKHSLDREKR